MSEEVPRLPPEDEKRIRLEEIFRHEVQRSLQSRPARSRLSKVISALNSPAGVVLLSSVIIAGLSYALSNYIKRSSERSRQHIATQKLSQEIDARVSYFFVRVQDKEKFTKTPGEDPAIAVANYLGFYMSASPRRQKEGAILSIYPEYAGLTLLALVQRLDTTLRGRKQERADLLRKEVFGLYGEARSPKPTSAHEYEAYIKGFKNDLLRFRKRWNSGADRATYIVE